MVTARPASLRAYAQAAQDMASDVATTGAAVDSSLAAAVAGAVDVHIRVVDVDGLLGDVAQLIAGTATSVEGVATAFESADSSGAALLRARNAAVEGALPDHSSWDFWLASALGVLSNPVTRGSILGAGTLRLGQMWRAAGRLADAFVDRAILRAMDATVAGVAALPYAAVFRFGRAREIFGGVYSWGDDAAAAATARMAQARGVLRSASGVLRIAGRVAGPLAALADSTVLFGGSNYDGARGTADRVMAGVGLVGAGALIAVGMGIAAPIAVPVALIAGTAAAAWGVGNLVADNWGSITSTIRNLAPPTPIISNPMRVIGGIGRVLGFGG
jgi:hypothetical protein